MNKEALLIFRVKHHLKTPIILMVHLDRSATYIGEPKRGFRNVLKRGILLINRVFIPWLSDSTKYKPHIYGHPLRIKDQISKKFQLTWQVLSVGKNWESVKKTSSRHFRAWPIFIWLRKMYGLNKLDDVNQTRILIFNKTYKVKDKSHRYCFGYR